MSGFDKSRIVDVKEEDINEYICGICLNVLNDPTVVHCCRQTYCKTCIDEWLTKSNTCPNDRKILTGHDLSPAPRLVTNILNNMKIKCERHSDGCPAVVSIGQIEAHIESCQYFKCQKCGTTDPKTDHNCVQHLISTIEEMREQLNDLQRVAKGERDNNYTKKVRRCQCELAYYCLFQYIRDVIESSRHNLHSFVIRERRGKVVETDIAVEFSAVCKQAIITGNSLQKISSHIRDDLNHKYSEGGRYTWQVIVLACNPDGGNQTSFNVLHVNILTMLFDKLEITIFSSPRNKTK